MNSLVTIVLVRTEHPGNLGAVARAMMNFGQRDLRLVAPRTTPSHLEATQRALQALPILENCQSFPELGAALHDRTVTLATTRHPRHTPINQFSLERLNDHHELLLGQRVALVFGPEDHGLSNEEMQFCDWVVSIPSAAEFPSLNLSHAVACVLYEFYKCCDSADWPPAPDQAATTSQQREEAFTHLKEALLSINFLDPLNPERIMRDLRNLLARGQINQRELAILRGIARQILNIKA